MAIVVASRLPEDPPRESTYPVLDVECVTEFDYWAGLNSVWPTDEIIVNVERDMEFSDERVAGLLSCPHPICAYPYQVYPTKLQRFIYCASQDRRRGWITEGETWADWSSIGFCKIAPEVRDPVLCPMYWWYLEHSVHYAIRGPYRWCIHWPEAQHLHDYSVVPDHLW